ncbi:hypothetical protein V2A60_009773 [Cordyceps javanica]
MTDHLHFQLRTGASVISCALLSLPSETLIAIFQLLDPIDAVCLALASKHLLHVSAMVTIRVPSVAKHRNVLPSTCKLIYELLWRFTPKVDRKVAEEHLGTQPEKASEGYANGIDAGCKGARDVQEH